MEVYVIQVDGKALSARSSFAEAAGIARKIMDIRYGEGRAVEQGVENWSLKLFQPGARLGGQEAEVVVRTFTVDESVDEFLEMEQKYVDAFGRKG